MAFVTPYDVANRTCQHLGVPRIVNFSDTSKAAQELGFIMDKVRQAELRRFVWAFATRRAVLRKRSATSKRVTFAVYAAATTYAAGDVVQDTNGFLWLSTVGSNVGQSLGAGGVNPSWIAYFGPMEGDVWSASVTYVPGDVVYESTTAYLCVAATTNNDPATDAGAHWHPIAGATVASILTLSPLGYNPAATTARNLFALPANYLRMAAQDPKAAAVARLSVTGGIQYNDWEIEQGMIATAQTGPIVFRFVADTADVPNMDAMFCEAWGARAARETSETITQSKDKMDEIESVYAKAIADAQMISAIESGSTENDQPKQPQPASPSGRGQ